MAPPTTAAKAADAGVSAAGKAAGEKQDASRYVPGQILDSYHAPAMGERYQGLLGDTLADVPLLKRLNWLHVPLLVATPLVGLFGIATAKFYWQTWVFTFFFYLLGGFGITAGYHRLFAHRAYTAHPILRYFLMFAGTAAVEGSVRWWARDHRAHHRYVDTDKDPYAATKGFWYAHVGWMLVKQDKSRIGHADISDLNADPLVRFQHKWYLPLVVLIAFVLPTLVCGLGWGDYYGGYFIAGVARLVVVHHSTFFVNSLAHYAGAATYTDRHTARNSWITALLTLGEGYHNFHHEFPSDYRNGIEWYQYDPTKVFIWVMSRLGLATELQEFPANEVEKGKLQMRQKELDGDKRRLNWGPDPATLPIITEEQLAKRVSAGEGLVLLDGFVLDVGKFMHTHPGGVNFIRGELGKDVSAAFKAEVYRHSQAARNLAATFRVARLQGYWA
jgi:stearoyl-CoA desaturase (Delta-9 desaturase)